ncbi:JmjC domain-containing protein [Nocardia jinanensis]|uniref:JmjC domain-containing protein n=1 Tax=Nocardia jinanensis TaxID=382504 RepID=A0A917VX79_9NOCA|nr:cupin domain-containing protein [Nocardia jinanensis]GGL28590.1 hypothetical protein GCM10011588_49340 [Nocardia jinanensis]
MSTDPGFEIAQRLARHCSTEHRFARSAFQPELTELKVLEEHLWRDIMRPGPLWSNIRLVHEGKDLHPSKFMDARIGDGLVAHSYLNSARVSRYLLDGGTLIHNHLHENSMIVQRIQEALEYLVGARVWVQAYLTRTSESAFGPHVDDHNFLVLQVSGKKRWSVYEPGSDVPIVDNSILMPGDFMYLASDTPHMVSGEGVLSLHLTIAFDWLDRPNRFGSSLSAHVREEHQLARREGGALPVLLDPNTDPRGYAYKFAGRVRPGLVEGDGGIRLTDGDRSLLLDGRLRPVLEYLADGRYADFATLCELAEEVSETQMRAFVLFAVQNEILYC